MKLLVVSQYFWPENFIINDLVRGLVARGHDVTVLTGRPSYPDRSGFAGFDHKGAEGRAYASADVVRVPLFARGRGGWRLLLNYLSFAASASFLGPWFLRRRSFDAVFVFQPSPLTVMLPAWIFRRVFRAPVLLWVLDLWPDTLEAMGVIRGSLPRRMAHWLSGWLHVRADHIFTQSRRMTDLLRHRLPDATRVEFLPNWTVLDSRVEPMDVVPKWRDARFAIVVAGNVGDAQDFPAVLASLSRVADPCGLQLVVVGDGLRRQWVEEEVARRGLGSMVTFVGRVAPSEVRSHLSSADALLIALKAEPIFSMTVPARLQAYLSAGRPVLGMIDGEAADLILDAGVGIGVPAGDASALADAINALRGMSSERRAEMGQRARQFEHEMFDRERWIAYVEHTLQTVLNRIGMQNG